jgi:hypothetical protein
MVDKMITIKQLDTTVNLELAEEQELKDDDVRRIHFLQCIRGDIERVMEYTDPLATKVLVELYKQWCWTEDMIVKIWKFDKVRSDKLRKEYKLPHCSCPTMDNDDLMYGVTELRYIDNGCIYHGGHKK